VFDPEMRKRLRAFADGAGGAEAAALEWTLRMPPAPQVTQLQIQTQQR
jgi:hypothetical protein